MVSYPNYDAKLTKHDTGENKIDIRGPSTYSLRMSSCGMLHICMVSMDSHVLKRGSIIVGLVGHAHHGSLGHRPGQQRGFSGIRRYVLSSSTCEGKNGEKMKSRELN